MYIYIDSDSFCTIIYIYLYKIDSICILLVNIYKYIHKNINVYIFGIFNNNLYSSF